MTGLLDPSREELQRLEPSLGGDGGKTDDGYRKSAVAGHGHQGSSPQAGLSCVHTGGWELMQASICHQENGVLLSMLHTACPQCCLRLLHFQKLCGAVLVALVEPNIKLNYNSEKHVFITSIVS